VTALVGPKRHAMSNTSTIVELVGPAGAGKSTITRALAERNADIETGFRIRRAAYAPRFAQAVLSACVSGVPVRGGVLGWRTMAYLDTLQRVLTTRRAEPRITLFDQGPVFLLSLLSELTSIDPQAPSIRWWDRRIRCWARTLDLIVWLDAPDEILADRMDRRPQRHRMKHALAPERRVFFRECRQRFSKVVAALTAHGPVQVVRLDTSARSLDETLAEVETAVRACEARKRRVCWRDE